MQPLGRRTFTAGEVLTAANINGYLMAQVISVFSAASARDAAITSPQEGQFAYLTSASALYRYTAASWQEFAPDSGGVGGPEDALMLMGG